MSLINWEQLEALTGKGLNEYEMNLTTKSNKIIETLNNDICEKDDILATNLNFRE